MQPATPPVVTVHPRAATDGRRRFRSEAERVVRVTIDADDRHTRRVVEAVQVLQAHGVEVEIRDARQDASAAEALQRLVCCGAVTPVVEVGGLLLTAPTPAEAILAVRRVLPEVG